MGANALDVPKETGRPVSMASSLTSDQATFVDEKNAEDKTISDTLSEKHAGSVADSAANRARAGTEDSKAAAVVTGGDAEDDAEYPSGFKLFFIIVALVLGVFLLALDMVGFSSSSMHPFFKK